MSKSHQHDFWLLPSHEDLTQQILSVIDEIAALDQEIRNTRESRSALREKRKSKVEEIRKAVNNAYGEGDAKFVSDFYTHITSQVDTSLDDDKAKQDIWRELFDGCRPNYPHSPIQIEHFLPNRSALNLLPDGSWLLSLGITLIKPYTSKSETEFHFSHNPIARDHLTGYPIVRPTGWKGHLHFAAGMASVSKSTVRRLFGESLGDDHGRSGRLRFFPTFFTGDVQQEVVTPLKRNTRTPARGPIDIEVVPKGSTGTFCLLYLPQPKDSAWPPVHIADDLEAAASALRVMFLEYGFSAKKTSGWGVVEDGVSDGCLWTRGPAWPPLESTGERGEAPPFEAPDNAYLALIDEAGMPKAGLRKSDGAWLSNKEFKALADQPCSLGVYKRFRSWYDVHGALWQRQLVGREARPAVPIRTYTVESVTALCDLATRLAAAMRKGSANG